ncbi:MAG: type IV secretory system conjugative DNA transfer family protein [Thermoplasmata archaeon]
MFDYDPSARGKNENGPGDGILLGYDIRQKPVFISEKSMEGHLSVTGKTGTGKSSLLVSMIRSMDRCAGNVIVIDPHGTLIDSVFESKRQLVYISGDSADKNGKRYSVKMNIIDRKHDPDLTSGWIRDIFSSESFSNNTWGPRLEVIFRSVLPEYIRNEESPSLAGFIEVITSPRAMKLFLEKIENRSLKSFLETYTSDRQYWREYIASSLNKMLPALTNLKIKTLVSSQDSFDFYRELSRGDSLIFIDASKGKVSQEASEQISFLFLMRIWFDSLYRYNSGEVVRNYIFIDEAQNVPKQILKTMLSEGRKYGISLILSNQYISQAKDYSDSLYGNVRNYISFNVSENDASFLGKTIPDARMSRDIYGTILNQRLHKFIYWSTDRFSSHPVSLEIKPYECVRDDRIQRSIIRYGSEDMKTACEEDPERLHERILSAFDSYLFSKQIELKHGKIGSSVPDGFFYYESVQYIVEVEISDVERPFRILRKLRDYRDFKIIFITNRERSEKLWNILDEPIKNFEANPCVKEGDERICLDDISSLYQNVFPVIYDGAFYMKEWSDEHRFSLNRLKITPYMKKIQNNKYYPIINIMYEMMRHDHNYMIRKYDFEKIAIFDKKYLNNFFEKKEIMSLYDIFHF